MTGNFKAVAKFTERICTMHPVLVHIFSIPLHSYGIMLALSFLLSIWLSCRRARKNGLMPDVIADVGFWIIMSAIVGARLYYVLLHPEEFSGHWASAINPFQGGSMVGIGGLVMYGGFIGAILSGIIYFKLNKLPFLPYADMTAPYIGLGIFLTRIGCFLNGCCYGGPTDSKFGVSFPLDSPAGVYQHECHAVGLYPSQLVESGGGLLIMIIILLVGRKKTFAGFQFYLMGLLYAVLRFFDDFLRFYAPDERILSLSHNQILCIGLFILFGGLILKHIIFPNDHASEENPAA